MTIEREGSVYTKGSVYTDAIDRKKESGWKSTRYQGEWQDVCPKCQGNK